MPVEATQLILGADVAVGEWVRRRLAAEGVAIAEWGPMTTIGLARGERLIAGVVYNNFRWPSVEASIAAADPGWCSRRILGVIFRFPFGHPPAGLGCRRLGAATAATNQPVRAFLCRLGFREEGICRQALPPSEENPDGDAAIYGMTPAECRWL